jgi:hypothetical protein
MGTKKRGSVRKAVGKVATEVRKAGGRVAHAVVDTSELIYLRRNDRAIRSEMGEHMHAIGKRAFSLHKRARGESPFSRFTTIMRELDALVRLEEEFRTNRARLAQHRQEMRHRGW